MPATPAEVANDLWAQAAFFAKRDVDLDVNIASLCRDSARLIRAMLAKEKLDTRVYGDVVSRLATHIARHGGMPERETQIAKSLRRALETLQTLRAG